MHDGCGEIVDSYRDICGDPSLVAGGEGELSHPRHLGDVGEEHDQEAGLLQILKLGAHQSKHDQARNNTLFITIMTRQNVSQLTTHL